MKLLVINDDQASAKQLSNALSKHYCVVDIAPDGMTGLGMIQQWEYDSILLNFKLPDLDGIHLCHQLRQQSCTTPILMLMPQIDTDAAIRSLEAGADDCVSNSADTRLLLARLRALQRRQTKEFFDSLLSWGPLKLDTNQFRVSYHDFSIFLSPREYRLLELFLQHPKRIFTRDAILDKLWTIDDPPSTATVTNLVKDLRRKLRDAGVIGQPITTVHRMGYQLSPPPPEVSTAAAPVRNKSCLPYPQLSNHHLVVETFQTHWQGHLAVMEALALALQQDTLTLELQQQVRSVADPFAVILDTLGYCQASNIWRTIDYVLASTLPLSFAQSEHLQELLIQLDHSLTQASGPCTIELKLTL